MQHRAKPSRNALRLPSLQQLKTCRKSQESSSESESDSSDSSDSSSSGSDHRKSKKHKAGKRKNESKSKANKRDKKSKKHKKSKEKGPDKLTFYTGDTRRILRLVVGELKVYFVTVNPFPDVREILKIVRKAYPQACSGILGNETRKFVGHRSLLIY